MFGCYMFLIVVLVSYLCFFAWMMVKKSDVELVRTTTIIVAVCSIILLFVVTMLMVIGYFIEFSRIVVNVVPVAATAAHRNNQIANSFEG